MEEWPVKNACLTLEVRINGRSDEIHQSLQSILKSLCYGKETDCFEEVFSDLDNRRLVVTFKNRESELYDTLMFM